MTFAMVLISLNVLAQEMEPEEKLVSSQLGYFYSSDYSHGSFKGSYGYATGLIFSKIIKHKYSVDIGLLLSSRSTYVDRHWDVAKKSPTTGIWTMEDTVFSLKDKHQYIEIPIKLKYFLLQKDKINAYLTAGISTNYYRRALLQWGVYTEPEGVKFPDNTFVFSTLAGFGIEYKLNENWNLTVQPEFRYYFTTSLDRLVLGSNIYAVGLNCGLSHNFFH